MDIGREITRHNKDRYDIRLYFKSEDGKLKKSEKKTGRVFIANIDEFGRIYIPREINEMFVGVPVWAFITLTIYGNLILFKDTSAKLVFEKIYKRIDTKAVIDISRRKSKELPGNPFFDSGISVKLKSLMIPVVYYPELVIKTKKRFRKFDPRKGYPELGEGEKLWLKRNRLSIERCYLRFIGVDVRNITKEEIVLFYLEDEIEIWEKSKWEMNVNKILWASKDARAMFCEGFLPVRQKHNISAWAYCSIEQFLVEEMQKRKELNRIDDVRIMEMDYIKNESAKMGLIL